MRQDEETSGSVRPADITGRVTVRYDANEPLVLLVEATRDREIAYLEVGTTAAVLRQASAGNVPASRAELLTGILVAAWYSGPVRETNPPQATAATVLILQSLAAATAGSRQGRTEERFVTDEDVGDPASAVRRRIGTASQHHPSSDTARS